MRTTGDDDIDLRMLRLHQELRAIRDIVEVLRKEIIKLEKRVIKLEAPPAP